MLNNLFHVSQASKEEHWISISDLMSGLMVIFLFIAISYMKDIVIENNRMEQIAVTWNETQETLYLDLYNEFKDDLPRWKATLDKQTLSVRFHEPSVLFDSGEDQLKDSFKSILEDFFPRYINVLQNFKGDIDEVRIEGHTSSEWYGAKDELDAYFRNMKLSQDRTRAVLSYCVNILPLEGEKQWAITTITANGLSSSKPVIVGNEEDYYLSRRVEFRVKTKAEEKIVKILTGDA